MSKALEKKKQMVAEIAEKLKNSKSTTPDRLPRPQRSEMNELRKQLREAGVEYKVLKNTLTRRATAETGLSELDQHLTGPTAIAFSEEDVVAPAKILHQFSKDHEALEIKGGVVEGRVVGFDEIKELATLPSREGLLSMLLACCRRRCATSRGGQGGGRQGERRGRSPGSLRGGCRRRGRRSPRGRAVLKSS